MVKAMYENAALLGHVAIQSCTGQTFRLGKKRNVGKRASPKPKSAFLAQNFLNVSNIYWPGTVWVGTIIILF